MIQYEITNPKAEGYKSGYLNDCHNGCVGYTPVETKDWKSYYEHEEKEIESILTRFGYTFKKHGQSEKAPKVKKKGE